MFHEWRHAIDVLESNQGVGMRLPCVVAAVDEVGLDDDRRSRKVRSIFKRVRAAAGIPFTDALATLAAAPHLCQPTFNMATSQWQHLK
jgi:hypothetical protein